MPYDIFGNKIKGNTFGFGMKPSENSGKRRPIDKSTRDAVWIKYMGNKVEGKCYCCKIRTIHITNYQVGHNKAVAKGGNDNISNLRPICSPCNRGMRTMSIEQYKKKYFDSNTKTQKIAIKKKTTVATKKKKRQRQIDDDLFPTVKPIKIKPIKFKPLKINLF